MFSERISHIREIPGRVREKWESKRSFEKVAYAFFGLLWTAALIDFVQNGKMNTVLVVGVLASLGHLSSMSMLGHQLRQTNKDFVDNTK